jgi:T-complex protein 1 subunit eta
VHGVAFKKTFSYAGFEQQPKKFTNPKICLLNIELELKSEKENAEVPAQPAAPLLALAHVAGLSSSIIRSSSGIGVHVVLSKSLPRSLA